MDKKFKMYSQKDKIFYYDYFPKVVHSNTRVTITIKSKFDGISLDGNFGILIMPFNDYDCNPYEKQERNIISTKAENGRLTFEYEFGSEQAYALKIAEIIDDEYYLLFNGMFYALDDDLYGLVPLKGDFHSHTIYSDGYESPDMVINAAKKYRLDFIAITDHNNYEGSEQGKKENIPDITVINGEEFSCDYTPMHIISLGAKKAVDSQYYKIGFAESPEVKQIVEADKEKIYSDITAYACTQALIDKIHENEGLAVLCHAYWKPLYIGTRRMDVPESLLFDLLNNCKFDAFEIVTGSPIDDGFATDMQFALLQNAGLTAKDIAFFGVTDSHMYSTDPLCGNHFTIVFATENSEQAIIQAVRDKLTVAVEKLDKKIVKCYGDYRLIKYAHFLIKYVFS